MNDHIKAAMIIDITTRALQSPEAVVRYSVDPLPHVYLMYTIVDGDRSALFAQTEMDDGDPCVLARTVPTKDLEKAIAEIPVRCESVDPTWNAVSYCSHFSGRTDQETLLDILDNLRKVVERTIRPAPRKIVRIRTDIPEYMNAILLLQVTKDLLYRSGTVVDYKHEPLKGIERSLSITNGNDTILFAQTHYEDGDERLVVRMITTDRFESALKEIPTDGRTIDPCWVAISLIDGIHGRSVEDKTAMVMDVLRKQVSYAFVYETKETITIRATIAA